MKKTIITFAVAFIATITTTFAASAKAVKTDNIANEKAIKKQSELYGAESNAKWINAENGFVAQFTKNDKQATSAYDEKGNWVYTIFRYTEDKMDESVRDNVKSVYYLYNITGIEQIEQPGTDTVYLVHIENGNDVKIIRVTKDEMDVAQEFTKQAA